MEFSETLKHKIKRQEGSFLGRLLDTWVISMYVIS